MLKGKVSIGKQQTERPLLLKDTKESASITRKKKQKTPQNCNQHLVQKSFKFLSR